MAGDRSAPGSPWAVQFERELDAIKQYLHRPIVVMLILEHGLDRLEISDRGVTVNWTVPVSAGEPEPAEGRIDEDTDPARS